MSEDNMMLHRGHRKRMKAQFIENGFGQFNDHQKLELLLFYTNPRSDTNVLAHTLLNECGGKFHNVFDSSYRRLLSIKGVNEHTAVFLKLIPEAASYYLRSKRITVGESVAKELDDIRKYFEGVFMNVRNEEIHAMAVGHDLRILSEKKICEGTVGYAGLPPRKLMDFVTENNCDRVIIAHNHPRGAGIASREDIFETRRLVRLFKEFDVEIVDHIVVGPRGSQSMRWFCKAGDIWETEEEKPEIQIE